MTRSFTGAKTESYLDTSALIAALDQSDIYHRLFARLFAHPPALVASALVIAEGHGWFLRRYDSTRALQFLDFISELPRLTIEPFGPEALEPTTEVLKKYADQSLTATDAHGLAIMRSRRIRFCWSTDRHLGLNGAALVISHARRS